MKPNDVFLDFIGMLAVATAASTIGPALLIWAVRRLPPAARARLAAQARIHAPVLAMLAAIGLVLVAATAELFPAFLAGLAAVALAFAAGIWRCQQGHDKEQRAVAKWAALLYRAWVEAHKKDR